MTATSCTLAMPSEEVSLENTSRRRRAALFATSAVVHGIYSSRDGWHPEVATGDKKAAEGTDGNSVPAAPNDDCITASVSEACRLHGLCRTSIYALLQAKRLSAVKVNRRTLISLESMHALLTPD